jgi:hypothetical protein
MTSKEEFKSFLSVSKDAEGFDMAPFSQYERSSDGFVIQRN